MPQCEMCGAEKSSLTTTKVEGAELDLCDDCSDFGTEVKTQSSSSASTKYSTSSGGSSGGASGSSGSGGSGGSSGGSSRRRDMFDQMDEIASDYDTRIRQAREREGLSQEELAKELNEKASLIQKLERSDTLPNDTIKQKLERRLDISLSEGGDDDEANWDSDSSMSQTLGDVVKRKE